MKNRKIIFILLILVPICSQAQNLIEAEYFIDTDPGVGNGTPLSVTSGSQVEGDFEVPTDGLSSGRHWLYIRSKDDQGAWSLFLKETFFLNNAQPAINISKVEYFLNKDPGAGLGTIEDVNDNDNIDVNLEISTDTLTKGLHFLYVRVADDQNIWSQYVRKRIQVFENVGPSRIVAFEYSYDSIPSDLQGIPESVAPGHSLDDQFQIPTDGLTGGKHTVHVKVVSENGKWSSFATDTFEITDCAAIDALEFSLTSNFDEVTLAPVADDQSTGSGLVTSILSNPLKGRATLDGNGNIEYQPNEGTIGPDSLQYKICNDCGSCDSTWIYFEIANVAPQISDSIFTVQTGTIVELDLTDLITDQNNNLDVNSFELANIPEELAGMLISGDLKIELNLEENDFTGTSQFTISVCDLLDECSQQAFTVVVTGGELIIYNAVSPNDDGNNDYMEIQSIEQYPENKFVIFDRWGDKVFEMEEYNNSDRRFEGIRNIGGNAELPSGTYYYELTIYQLSEKFRGFIVLKK